MDRRTVGGMVISVIVPVFNAGKYLAECLESALQALDGVKGEILVVDNGSSDNSTEVMAEYRKKYPKMVRVLQCHTKGAAAARNYGVKEAKGEYIWFVDADDYVAENSVKLLVAEAECTGADLVMMGADRGDKGYLSAVDAGSADYKSRFIRYGMGPWQVLIRRKWWMEHGFCFAEGRIHEDMELMSSLVLYTDKFASIDKPLYFYRQTPNSVLHRRSWSEHAYDIFPALEGLLERFKAVSADSIYHDELEWFFIWNLLIDSAEDFAAFPEGRPGFKRSREMLAKYFPNWRKNRFLREKPLRLRIRVRINYCKG